MTSSWASLLMVVGGLALPGAASGQSAKLGLQGVVTTANPGAATFGAFGAIRVARRVSLAATAGAGTEGGEFAYRLEALGHFALSPESARSRWYLGGGVAFQDGESRRGLMVALLGWEYRLGAGSVALEGGVGGGARLSAGYRWWLGTSR